MGKNRLRKYLKENNFVVFFKYIYIQTCNKAFEGKESYESKAFGSLDQSDSKTKTL